MACILRLDIYVNWGEQKLGSYQMILKVHLCLMRNKPLCYLRDLLTKGVLCSSPELVTELCHSSSRVFMGASVVGLILWLALDTAQRPEQLISFAGICMFILILFACSKHHSAVSLGHLGWA